MIENKNVWKYSTVGLLAVLAIGFVLPQATAHIANNNDHMLQHIYNFVNGIEAKTDNLPDQFEIAFTDVVSETPASTGTYEQHIPETDGKAFEINITVSCDGGEGNPDPIGTEIIVGIWTATGRETVIFGNPDAQGAQLQTGPITGFDPSGIEQPAYYVRCEMQSAPDSHINIVAYGHTLP